MAETNPDDVSPSVVRQPFLNAIVTLQNAEVTADGSSTAVNFAKDEEWIYLVLTVTTIESGDTNGVLVEESETSGGTYTTLHDFGTITEAGVTTVRVRKTKRYLKVTSDVTLAGVPGVHQSVLVIH